MYDGRIGGGGTLYAFVTEYDVGNDVVQPAPVPQPGDTVTGATDGLPIVCELVAMIVGTGADDVGGRTHTGADDTDDKYICEVDDIVVTIFGGFGIAYT